MIKKIKNEIGVIFGIIAIVQILIMINAILAQSYSINQEIGKNGNDISLGRDFKNFFKGGFNFLVGFLTIKQIGIVSAQVSSNVQLQCCRQLTSGATCQDIASTDSSACAQAPYSTTCDNTNECKTGTCVINNGISCIVSPQFTCQQNTGNAKWVDNTPANVPECKRGCCVVGSNAVFETGAMCDAASGHFLASVNSEAACILVSRNLLQGACVTKGGGCKFTTGVDCNTRRGSFFAGILCTNPDLKQQLGVTCKSTHETMIIDGKDKVYWKDSCGNPGNIYDASKTDEADSNYWNIVSAPTCNVQNSDGSINQGALKSCGNCNQYLGTLGATKEDAKVNPTYGNFACKDLSCKVEVDLNHNGNTNDPGEKYTKNNGETWCMYDGSIGNVDGISSDPVGSEHWLGKCENGDLKIEHSNYRDKVCQQQTTKDPNSAVTFTSASLVTNQAPACFSYNPMQNKDGDNIQSAINQCNANSQCTVRTIDVDKQGDKPTFTFSVCVPKYPTGFDSTTAAQSYCAAASATCTVVYRKNVKAIADESTPGKVFGGIGLNILSIITGKDIVDTVRGKKDTNDEWDVVINGNCREQDFAQKMNNLCVSLGDCGSYVNYVGKGTDNAAITVTKGDSSHLEPDKIPGIVPWTNYIKYADRSKWTSQVAAPATETGAGSGSGINTGNAQIEDRKSLDKFLNNNNLIDFILSLGGLLKSSNVLSNNLQLGNLHTEEIQNSLGVGGLIIGGLIKYEFIASTVGGGTPIIAAYGTQTGEVIGQTAATPLAPFAGAAVGAFVGAYVGAYLAQQYHITGAAATTLVVAGGVAGGTLTYTYLATGASSAFLYIGIGALIVIAIIIISGYGTTETRDINFTCSPWQAPTGTTNTDCNKCNSNPAFPCTKYRCESLGQTCKILNENTDSPICESIAGENTAPLITAGKIAENYTIVNQTVGQSAKLYPKENPAGCIQEFSQFNFTLNTDEYAQCKWSYTTINNFDNAPNIPAEGETFQKAHTFRIGDLSFGMLNAFDITGDLEVGLKGEMKMYVKCKDYHNNINPIPYVVNFCLTQGPDITPVRLDNTVVATPENGATLIYGATNTSFQIFINEPAECKYDLTSLPYDQIKNRMSCNLGPSPDFIGRWGCGVGDYVFGTQISPLLNITKGTNKIYIKCKDQPWLAGTTDESKRNANLDDYVYTLRVTETPLKVNSISIGIGSSSIVLLNASQEIRGGGENFKVNLLAQTSGGNQQGKAQCRYDFLTAPLAYSGDFFFQTFSTGHKQSGLNLLSGNYGINVTCKDDVGNTAEKSATFNLVVDSSPPVVVRAFRDGGSLKLITDENAKCAYSTGQNYCSSGTVENGTQITLAFAKQHSTVWTGGQTYYIKCKDVYNNENAGCATTVIPNLEIT